MTRLMYTPLLKTNDPNEVSKVLILKLGEIIDLAAIGYVHEGSIRLIFNYLNKKTFGSLNEPTTFNGYTF